MPKSALAAIALATAVALVLAAPTPPTPIPDIGSAPGPAFIGTPGRGGPAPARRAPRHPFMARNGRGNIHDDAYMTDTYRWRGPIGQSMQRVSAYFPPGSDCASVPFDHQGRIISVCVSLTQPTLRMFDPETLDILAQFSL